MEQVSWSILTLKIETGNKEQRIGSQELENKKQPLEHLQGYIGFSATLPSWETVLWFHSQEQSPKFQEPVPKHHKGHPRLCHPSPDCKRNLTLRIQHKILFQLSHCNCNINTLVNRFVNKIFLKSLDPNLIQDKVKNNRDLEILSPQRCYKVGVLHASSNFILHLSSE